MSNSVHVLLLTNLYPNEVQVRKGVFIRERLRHLLPHPGLRHTVVAPVPWFPFKARIFGAYSRFASVPFVERDLGITVHHPRYLVIPKIGDFLTPLFYAFAVRRYLRNLNIAPVDVVDAHFVFPDGAAATLLARWLGCSACVTARGSDINLMMAEFSAGRWIRWCLRHASGLAAVSTELAEKMRAVISTEKVIHVIRNGVDRKKFRMLDRHDARQMIGKSGPLILSVGNLVAGKGHHHVIRAVAELAGVHLLVLGSGPMKAELTALIAQEKLTDRVTILDEVQHDEVAKYYNAADVLVLASRREGMPNVVLESMACGTPVISTGVGGMKEFFESSSTATKLESTEAKCIAAAIQRVLLSPPRRNDVCRETERFDWDKSSDACCDLLRKLSKKDSICVHTAR